MLATDWEFLWTKEIEVLDTGLRCYVLGMGRLEAWLGSDVQREEMNNPGGRQIGNLIWAAWWFGGEWSEKKTGKGCSARCGKVYCETEWKVGVVQTRGAWLGRTGLCENEKREEGGGFGALVCLRIPEQVNRLVK